MAKEMWNKLYIIFPVFIWLPSLVSVFSLLLFFRICTEANWTNSVCVNFQFKWDTNVQCWICSYATFTFQYLIAFFYFLSFSHQFTKIVSFLLYFSFVTFSQYLSYFLYRTRIKLSCFCCMLFFFGKKWKFFF